MNTIILILGIVVITIILRSLISHLKTQSQIKRAGSMGEAYVSKTIEHYLSKEDYLLKNVKIKVDGKEAEFDQIVLSKKGIYIFETKYYKGKLKGSLEDKEWVKTKTDPYGNTFTKMVRNPISQVKRETYLLSQYLKQHGFKYWIEGYVVLVGSSSPVHHEMMLDSSNKIKEALSKQTEVIDKTSLKHIYKLLR